ncbi:hypothetical protein [Arthrobacter celericrescens]|uniref:hypothetical protein n=1 Tax=Arthrobacter celericrescens TaxID=2320851 RepID=UPI000EA36BD3|nr:hypothetical protein [Arthrobacter celericrescens]
MRVFEAGALLEERPAGLERGGGLVSEHLDGELEVMACNRLVEGLGIVAPCRVVVTAAGDEVRGFQCQAKGRQDGECLAEFGAFVTGFEVNEEFP